MKSATEKNPQESPSSSLAGHSPREDSGQTPSSPGSAAERSGANAGGNSVVSNNNVAANRNLVVPTLERRMSDKPPVPVAMMETDIAAADRTSDIGAQSRRDANNVDAHRNVVIPSLERRQTENPPVPVAVMDTAMTTNKRGGYGAQGRPSNEQAESNAGKQMGNATTALPMLERRTSEDNVPMPIQYRGISGNNRNNEDHTGNEKLNASALTGNARVARPMLERSVTEDPPTPLHMIEGDITDEKQKEKVKQQMGNAKAALPMLERSAGIESSPMPLQMAEVSWDEEDEEGKVRARQQIGVGRVAIPRLERQTGEERTPVPSQYRETSKLGHDAIGDEKEKAKQLKMGEGGKLAIPRLEGSTAEKASVKSNLYSSKEVHPGPGSDELIQLDGSAKSDSKKSEGDEEPREFSEGSFLIDAGETYHSDQAIDGRGSRYDARNGEIQLDGSHDISKSGSSRLAVAQPVHETEQENSPVYQAIEYDPDVKPTPMYRNRKYQCYFVLALLVLGAVMAVAVVFGTKEAAPGTAIVYVGPDPTQSPTLPPTSSRFFLGIGEEIEANVLRRGATFQNMTDDDPRRLALEWILYVDAKQLTLADETLHQRYILALLAFSLDSLAWRNCGEGSSADDEPGICDVYNNDTGISVKNVAWLSGLDDECDWFGVTCNSDGRVSSLELSNNILIGEVVPEIAGLGDSLEVLDLSSNCLYGTVPPELGDLFSLENLDLQANAFSGAFPDEMYDLFRLKRLDLSFQRDSYWNCTRSDDSVVEMLYSMGKRDYGENAGFVGNCLDDRIGKLRNLRGIGLERNNFTGEISSELGKLERLVSLSLSENYFSGVLPTEITELTNLKELWLAENSLTGEILQSIGRLESLETFSVFQNGMHGAIPDSLYNLTKLKFLDLAENAFSGTISTNIGTLKKLQNLMLSHNIFSGSLPSEIGLCEALATLQFEGNNITGSVPEEVCQLRQKNLFSDYSFHEFFKADCWPDNKTSIPLVECDCCYSCCDASTAQCVLME